MSWMKLDEIIHRIFWGLISAVSLYAATTMGNMQSTMAEMNMNLVKLIQRSEFLEKTQTDHETRLRHLENR